MKKVLILGCSGSGKSTFSKQLGRITGLPVVHLDSLYWKPGWVASSESEWDQVIKEQIQNDEYIMDGTFSRTLELRLKEADTVFYFDYSRYFCLYRVLKRRIRNHGRTRPDMADGCEEKIDLEFIQYIWSFNKTNRPNILKSLEEVKESKNVVIFKSPKDVKIYLKTIVQSGRV